MTDLQKEVERLRAENIEMRRALTAVMVDALRCGENPREFVITEWALEKVRRAAAVTQTPPTQAGPFTFEEDPTLGENEWYLKPAPAKESCELVGQSSYQGNPTNADKLLTPKPPEDEL